MKRILSRTSITIDEAVYILLGLSDGPIEFEPMDDSEEAEANVPVFCLQEALEDEPDQEALVGQADAYHCEIADELNKGEQSVLKVDRGLSNAAYMFITLHSFDEWRKQRTILDESKPDRAELVGADSEPVKVQEGKKKKSRDKMRRQERAILEAIKELRHDAKTLPPRQPGKAGIKAAVFEVVMNSGLFDNSDIFDAAWERLRKAKDIREVDTPPYKKS